jgi:uncharacterized protein
MEPQLQSRTPATDGGNPEESATQPTPPPKDKPQRDPSWLWINEDGLRSGWSAALFVALFYLVLAFLDTVVVAFAPQLAENAYSPFHVLIAESIPLFTIVVVGLLVAKIEHRRLADYHLDGSQRLRHFASGLATGFGALSTLIAALFAGGWIRFGHVALHPAQALGFGFVWACAFLLVGLFEEGSFRCYLLYTLKRGINFWWALAAVASLCLLLALSHDPKGSSGVFLIAALGVVPCGLVQRMHLKDSGFWQASWATSTAFGYFHTSNSGENAIGIFAASFIGFVFCVSVRVTGSAWWAIGCHTAWDWAETYFYGTPDSGFVAQRHFLTTSPAGNILWSGGADGPEGSLLIVPVILLLALALLIVYGRNPSSAQRRGDQAA